MSVGQPPGCLQTESSSALPEDALDNADGNPIDLGDLGDRQPVLHPGSDARVVRPRDLARGPGARDPFLQIGGRGSTITSDAGLLAYRELDDTLGLTNTGANALADARTGKNGPAPRKPARNPSEMGQKAQIKGGRPVGKSAGPLRRVRECRSRAGVARPHSSGIPALRRPTK